MYLYRLMENRPQFSDIEHQILTNQTTRNHASVVSVWEMRLKFQARRPSGEPKSPFDPNDVVTMLENQNMIFLPMTMDHAASRLEIPLDHKDPFDELLLVQAQEEGLKLLTTDRRLGKHPLAIVPTG